MSTRKSTLDKSDAEVRRLQALSWLKASPDRLLALPEELFLPSTSREMRLRETRRAYKNKSLLVHPDRCSHAGATGAFRILHEAYETVVLRGWVLDEPAKHGFVGKNERSMPTTPPMTAEERMQHMEDWMRKAHQSYFRGRPRSKTTAQAESESKNYADIVNDMMEKMDQEDADEDDNYGSEEIANWMRKVHNRAAALNLTRNMGYDKSYRDYGTHNLSSVDFLSTIEAGHRPKRRSISFDAVDSMDRFSDDHADAESLTSSMCEEPEEELRTDPGLYPISSWLVSTATLQYAYAAAHRRRDSESSSLSSSSSTSGAEDGTEPGWVHRMYNRQQLDHQQMKKTQSQRRELLRPTTPSGLLRADYDIVSKISSMKV
ncbi:hypothetical protein PhCBS80983_g01837 [Powellomyces hirtus]|uniref:J domain-containing protein n=1 Tax=Powellomyces hirtus TaxID=109895 RepID=A0A507EBF3_9FUNG|nr:hypothetical protein PhCBS80983_g01837 [Powellomyces hirtus]